MEIRVHLLRMIQIKKTLEKVAHNSHYKSLNQSLKECFKWTTTGFWLYYLNLKCSSSLIHKRILGNDLTFDEKHLVKTAFKDTVKILPFSFFIIIPFAEFGLPFAIKLFPSMLPSTFTLASIKEREKNALENKKSELLKFHSNIKSIISNLKNHDDSSINLGVNSLEKIQKQLLEGKEFDQDELCKISEHVRDGFELENLNIETLRLISRIMDISFLRNKFLLILKIRYKLLKLKNEDKDILWDGIDNINKQLLQKVLVSRLINPNKIEHGVDEHKELLMNWIRLSSMNQLPLSIILWIQVTRLLSRDINKL